MSEDTTESRELTPEEQVEQEALIAKRKAELLEFYTAELPLLQKQADYEETITRIEAAKFERLQIAIHHAQIMQGPPKEGQQPPHGDQPEGPAPDGQPEVKPEGRTLAKAE